MNPNFYQDGTSKISKDQERRDRYFGIAITLVIFGCICLFSAFVLSTTTGKTNHFKSQESGEILGPITTVKDKTVLKVKVKSHVGVGKYNFVSLSLLDEQKNHLFSFGDEFWAEEGYDSEGRWYENKDQYKLKITVPKKGTYFLQTDCETNTKYHTLRISVEQKLGSSLLFTLMGIFSIILAIGFNELANGSIAYVLEELKEAQ